MKFFKLLEKELHVDCLSLYGLQLEINQTEFQIDSLLIFQNKIYLFEIKNFSGDYYVNEDRWYSVSSRNEIRNPLHQLKRCELLLQQLLRQLNYNIEIEYNLVYVNSEFFLYEAPFNESIIFPSQLMRFVRKLNNNQGKITNSHKNLAKQLVKRHISRSSHERLPEYTYEVLRKGIVCNACQRFLETKNRTSLACRSCGNIEQTEEAVMRSIEEYRTLFPDRKITTTVIHDWCKIITSKRMILRILKKNLIQVGSHRSSCFKFK